MLAHCCVPNHSSPWLWIFLAEEKEFFLNVRTEFRLKAWTYYAKDCDFFIQLTVQFCRYSAVKVNLFASNGGDTKIRKIVVD
jgi:hypothetical protein